MKNLVFLLAVIVPLSVNASVTLSSRNAHSLCTTADMDWINFYNGLIQGYADFVVLSGTACIPSGTTRSTMITLYTDRLPSTQAFSKDEPALAAAIEIFSRLYPCQ